MKRSSIISLVITVILAIGALIAIYTSKHRVAPETPTDVVESTESSTPDAVSTLREIIVTPFTTAHTDAPTEDPTPSPTETPTPTDVPTATPEHTVVEQPTPEIHIDYELLEGVTFVVDPSTIHYWEPTYDQSKYISRYTENNEENLTLLAKLLCCEAGARTSWAMQVWTLSAILNNLDSTGKSLKVAAHTREQYSVADWVDDAVPSYLNYKAIDYVLNGHRIADINAFRTRYYHDFGTPVADVEGQHYFTIAG